MSTPDKSHFTRLETKHVPIADLREHPQHLDMPLDQEAFQALCQDVAANGVTNRLVVVQAEVGYEVLAGNQRLKAAKAVGIIEVPVEVISTDDPISVMLADNVLGRPRTKSAIALQVFMYYRAELADQNKIEERKNSGLQKGKKLSVGNDSPRRNIGVSSQSLADKYGFDHHLLLDLADIWRMCQECSDRAIGDDTWTQAVAAIASGECSTSRAKAGVGGRQKTLGKKRGDPKWFKLIVRSATTLGNAWKHWEDILPPTRKASCEAFAESLQHIPDDGIAVIKEALPTWSVGNVEKLANAAAEQLGCRLVKNAKNRE
jgi:hypothetical protein